MNKKTAVWVISLLSVAVVVVGALAINQYNRSERYKLYMSASYQRAFGELVSSIEEIDTSLQKSLYATSPAVAEAVYTDIFGKAMTAQMTLGVLPFSTTELEQTAGFVSRVGDYAYSLSRIAASGSGQTVQQRENLKSLSDTASLLSNNLTQLQSEMSSGELTMDELEASQDALDKLEDESLPTTLGGGMRLIEREFPEIPSLIYDGPFSEHLTNSSPKLIEGRDDVSAEKGAEIAANFIGADVSAVSYTGTREGDIPCYCYSVQGARGEYTAYVTVKGGEVLNVISMFEEGEAALSAEQAVEQARSFLEERGYGSMAESYYMINGGEITVNFAYKQGDVICYSDLVKVSLTLDDGTFTGFEAKGYIMAHTERSLPEASVGADEARSKVSGGLEIQAESLALIPTEGKYELLCYEFKCRNEEDKHYIIYVNAQTGEQEKILILLEDENGTLTL